MDIRLLRRAALLIFALLLLVFEGFFQFQRGLGLTNWLAVFISIGMYLGLSVASRFLLAGTAVYLLFYLSMAIAHADAGVLTLGLYALAIGWIATKKYLAAGVLLLLAEGVSYFENGFKIVSLLGSVLGIMGSVAIGLVLRWSQDRVDTSYEEARIAREKAREEVYRDLAVELHNTVARDLSRVILAAELLARESNSSALLEQIQVSAQEALKSTRTMVAGLAKTTEEESFQQVVEKCSQMLATRNIQLHVDIPDGLYESMSGEVRETLVLALKEGAANILKYAAQGSEAELLVEGKLAERILLTLSNDCGEERVGNLLLSGGFGLKNLAARLSNVGGVLRYMKVNDRWILVAEIHEGQSLVESADMMSLPETSSPAVSESERSVPQQ